MQEKTQDLKKKNVILGSIQLSPTTSTDRPSLPNFLQPRGHHCWELPCDHRHVGNSLDPHTSADLQPLKLTPLDGHPTSLPYPWVSLANPLKAMEDCYPIYHWDVDFLSKNSWKKTHCSWWVRGVFVGHLNFTFLDPKTGILNAEAISDEFRVRNASAASPRRGRGVVRPNQVLPSI